MPDSCVISFTAAAGPFHGSHWRCDRRERAHLPEAECLQSRSLKRVAAETTARPRHDPRALGIGMDVDCMFPTLGLSVPTSTQKTSAEENEEASGVAEAADCNPPAPI